MKKMRKKTYQSVQLTVMLQNENELPANQCLAGVLSCQESGVLFEEAVHHRRHKRNPKLFDGNYVSMVHMANGRYHCHMKTIDASGIQNHQWLALQVYSELLDAFKLMC